MESLEDYPKNLMELEKRFATDDACREYLFEIRWPNGFVCPKCGSGHSWAMGRGLWLCSECRYQASVIAGTIFQDTKLSLVSWFRAIWYVTSQKNGASASNVQRILGLGSYRTSWTWLHKLRRAMVRPGREKLSGVVEVDETYLGGLEEGVPGREIGKKSLIIVAAEENGRGLGRIRLRRIEDASSESLLPFIIDSIECDSTVKTDGWPGYDRTAAKGYKHEIIIIGKRRKNASEMLPRVHLVISLLKRWLMGTHQGAVSHTHLDYYLDEFAFRFNRRTSRSRGKLFFRLLQQAVQVEPVPYKQIVSSCDKSAQHN